MFKLKCLVLFCMLFLAAACGDSGDGKTTASFDQQLKMAKQGDAQAQAVVCAMYFIGEEVKQDDYKAF